MEFLQKTYKDLFKEKSKNNILDFPAKANFIPGVIENCKGPLENIERIKNASENRRDALGNQKPVYDDKLFKNHCEISNWFYHILKYIFF